MPLCPQITNTPVDIVPTTAAITAITYTSSTATYTATAHGSSAGDVIIISDTAPDGYNGTFTLTSVTTNTFTLPNTTNAAVTVATGTAWRAPTDYEATDNAVISDSGNYTFYAASAPTAYNVGDIWFDTDDNNKQYRWDGLSWISVQDGTIATAQSDATTALANAATANAAAIAAQADATTAYNNSVSASLAAGTAQTTANGKNQAHYSASTPSGGGIAGDIWWQFSGGNVIAQWQYSGGAWIAAPIASSVIAGLDAGKITAGTITVALGITSPTGNFSLNASTGVLNATNAVIQGNLTSSSVNITGGTLNIGGNCVINSSGLLTATGATITGTITSTAGNIGGWKISTDRIYTGASPSSPDQAIYSAGGALFTGTTTCSALGVVSNQTIGGTLTVGSTTALNGTMNYSGIATGAGTSMVLVGTGSRVAMVTSSERFKTNITDINPIGWLDKILQTRPVTFYYDQAFTDPDDPITESSGFIAEDFADIPGLETVINRDVLGDPFSISYDRFTAFLVLAIKELNAKVVALETRLGA